MIERQLPRPFVMPWGKGLIIEEARYRGRYHEPSIQLMKHEDGALAIRFCYYDRGRFQRSPLMLSVAELKMMKKAFREAPRLKEILRKLVS